MSCRNVVTPPPGPSITPGDSMAQGGGTGEGKAEHSSIWDYGYGLILGVSTVRQPALQVNLPCGHQQCSKYLSAETVNPFSIIFNPALVFPDSLTGSDQDDLCLLSRSRADVTNAGNWYKHAKHYPNQQWDFSKYIQVIRNAPGSNYPHIAG